MGSLHCHDQGSICKLMKGYFNQLPLDLYVERNTCYAGVRVNNTGACDTGYSVDRERLDDVEYFAES